VSAAAFYERDGERFAPTELTRGPWDPDAQHAGPPAALLGTAIASLDGDEPRQVGRITFEILRSVPLVPLTVSAEVVRPGRSVELCTGTLADERGPLIRASAWRLREVKLDLPDLPRSARVPPPPTPPERSREGRFFPTGERGYQTAMEYRFAEGAFLEPGPAVAWLRMRVPLVEGEAPTPLERLLVAADSGNGVSATLDFERFVFINVDLSVHVHRLPAGEWVCLDAITVPEPSGVGLSDTLLWDERGPIGRAAQTLLVRER
jgi:Thioesterase-like superfamily